MNTTTCWTRARENVGMATLTLAIIECPWISIVNDIAYVLISGDIVAKGTARILLYLCIAAPCTLGVVLGAIALAQSASRADKILGIIGLIANIFWTGYLALVYSS